MPAPARLLGAELLDEDVLFVDETRCSMLGHTAWSAKWRAWTMASEKSAYYEIHDTRGLEVGKSLLVGFKGCAVTDGGYAVYDALEKKVPGLRIVRCPAQSRRLRYGLPAVATSEKYSVNADPLSRRRPALARKSSGVSDRRAFPASIDGRRERSSR